ncbi:MAG: IS21 family transposase [Candidatus Levybacteria bacterium]|nr:IS21 family transposase [Candidatus Levybacteria bacterium]
MYKQITIKTLFKQGEKKSQIARELSCHRNTVSNIVKRDRVIEKQTRVRSSVFDPYKQKISEYLDKKISRLRIFELLGEEYGVMSTYINLCKYIQNQFPKRVEAYGVQVVEPGEVAEIDFGELGLLPGPQGRKVRTFGLAVILPYSKLDFYAICYDQKLQTLITELTNAFLYFGGVPKRLKVDNMKTAILRNQHYDLEFNRDFLEFAEHYNTVVLPCSPYSPQQKGTVESGIKYLQGNFVAGRQFQDDADIKRQLRNWMDGYANQRIHGTTRKIPKEVFELEEKSKLQLLPREEFAFFNRAERVVAPNCHIHFDNNYYSVPAGLVGKEVTLRWNEHLLRIICRGEQVALHCKTTGQGNYVTQRSHLPDYKVYSQTEYQAKFEAKMADIGEYAHKYFTMLLDTKQSYWFRNVRIILGLEKEYGRQILELALKRALYYQAVDIIIIKNILQKKLYLLGLEPGLEKVSDDCLMSRSLEYYKGGGLT